MSRELDLFRRQAEQLMQRNTGSSRAAREAAKRSLERGVRSFLIRLRRAGITFTALLGALVVYMIAAGFPGIVTLALALLAILLAAIVVMFLPVRQRRRDPAARQPRPVVDGGKAVRLDQLAAGTEDWLLERCRALPHQAAPALDRVIDRLRDLEPSLATVPSATPLGGQAQRLIGEHLPGLVDTYLNLPPAERGFHSETSRQLAESLGIVADQLDDLCERVATERRMGFDTERRFIESRYRDGDRLGIDPPR